MSVEVRGFLGERVQEEVVGRVFGGGVGDVEGEGERAVEEVGEGNEGGCGRGEVEEEEGGDGLGFLLVGIVSGVKKGGGLHCNQGHNQCHSGTWHTP